LLVCPTCQTRFEGEEQFCPHDGSPLQLPSSPATPAADPLVGRVVGGRYRLVDRLGQGGMGTVYRARHTLMDKPVAVKVLRAELATDGEAVARFHREARSASKLDHDHCIRVTDFGQSDDGLLYLVMELLDGVSLGQLVRKGPLPWGRAAAIGVAIAEALTHAHGEGVIHRDLKPDNVFLARRSRGRETVKVLDFGLAKLVADGTLGPSITRDGTVFGTPEYMAPEQAEGEKLDGRTDLYALGIMLYQMVTGDVPFRSSNFVALLTKQVQEAPVPPRARRPDLDIPPGLEAVIMRCLAKRPADRFPTAQDLADALAPYATPTDDRGDATGPQALLPASAVGAEPSLADAPAETVPGVPFARTDSDAAAETDDAGTSTGDAAEGEPVAPPSAGRRIALVAGGLGLAAVAGVLAWTVWHGRRAGGDGPPSTTTALVAPATASANDPLADVVADAERLLAAGQAEEAERRLREARKRADSSALQAALAAVDEARGNRLAALAHLERASRLAPKDARPRAELAALLFRLGQATDACRAARAALQLDPDGARSKAARTVVTQARCKEVP
jgi:serine/threonine-protein kinase